jgi:hypothetical protein
MHALHPVRCLRVPSAHWQWTAAVKWCSWQDLNCRHPCGFAGIRGHIPLSGTRMDVWSFLNIPLGIA